MSDQNLTFTKAHVGRRASELKEPYSGTEVARIEDFGLSVFICQGSIAWHRHIDEDEMFLVYTGAITVDSDLGPVFLRPGELTVVPKGIRHRSASPIRSEVILFQPWLLADRHNGDRKMYAVGGQPLSKINLYVAALPVRTPFAPQPVTSIGDFSLSLTVCEGTSSERVNAKQATLLLTQQGEMKLTTGLGEMDLYVGDAVLIPKNVPFQLSAGKRSLLLEFSRPG